MPYIRPKTVSGTPSTYTKVPSSGMGFNSKVSGNGGDTAPGVAPGAPLNSRSVPDSATVRHDYQAGRGDTPGGLNTLPAKGIGTPPNGAQSLPADSPVSKTNRLMPDAHDDAKAAAENRTSMAIGNDPRGVMSR